jgi:asparagine synthase (glutamine-hydrolysing)
VLDFAKHHAEQRPGLAVPHRRQPSPLFELVQDSLRSDFAATVPFFDRRSVVGWLDQLKTMSSPQRAALDPVMLMLLSMCFLQERYRL